MQLLTLLMEIPKLRLLTAILASVISGIATVGVLICVLRSIRSAEFMWWQFMCFAALAVVSRTYARLIPESLTARATLRLRRRMVRSLLNAPLEEFERIGAARLLVGFTTDLSSIGTAVRNFVHLFSGAAFLLGCLAYLGWLSPKRAIVTGILLVFTIAVAIMLRQMEHKHGREVRGTLDRIIHAFRMVLDGVKQLKLNRTLSRHVLLAFETRVRDVQKPGSQRGWYSEAVPVWIQSMSFVILGVAVFGPFNDNVGLLVASYGVLALLYMRGPMQSLVADSGAFSAASAALQRIHDLGLTLAKDVGQPDRALRRKMRGSTTLPVAAKWNSLELRNVVYRYEAGRREDDFVLGPVDIALQPREIVFVSGGNGSGKTTLLKVLTGLYTPTQGAILLDGVPVDETNVGVYRTRFAVVFSDFCLFENVADLHYAELGIEAERLARRFKLKTWMLGPHDSDRPAQLSAGERRRAALLMALLDDRPILIFDEWAADQDPQYKDVFYREIVSSLREKGKLVIVLSHDEKYFHLGDRILWLERGLPPVWRTSHSFGGATDLPSGGQGGEAEMVRPAK